MVLRIRMNTVSLRWRRFVITAALILGVCLGSAWTVKAQAGTGGVYRARNGTVYTDPNSEGWVWVPDGVRVVRGLIFLTIAKGKLDFSSTTSWVLRPNAELARGVDFALGGPGDWTSQQKNFDRLATLGALSGHPEIANASWCWDGFSHMGQKFYAYMDLHPQRVIAMISSFGGMHERGVKSAGAQLNHVLANAGQVDLWYRPPNLIGIVADNRPTGARWQTAMWEGVGHGGGKNASYGHLFFQEAIRARYPAGASPLAGPVTLTNAPQSSGWLCDMPGRKNGFNGKLYAWADYPSNRAAACWFANKDLAFAYRGATVYAANRFTDKLPNGCSISMAPTTSGDTANYYSPSETLQFSVHHVNWTKWQKVEFYDGGTKLGELKGTNGTICARRPQPGVHAFTAVATDGEGNEKYSNMIGFYVKKEQEIVSAVDATKNLNEKPGAK